MTESDVTFGVRISDLSLDDEGNVVVSNDAVARALSNAIGEPVGTANTNNCHGGNCAKGCGTKLR